MTIHLIHGINAEKKGGSPRFLAPYLRDAGFDVKTRSYGDMRWWQARFMNEKLAACFADSIAPGDILVGHSNGGALCYLIAKMGVPMHGVMVIQPALDSDKKWPPNLKWVDVIANRDDGIVSISTLLLGHMWGDLGQKGYTGPKDDRVTTIFTDDRRQEGVPLALGHTDILKKNTLQQSGPWISNRIQHHFNMEGVP